MANDLFRVKSVKKDKITLEEDRDDGLLIILFRRYGCLGILFLLLVFLILFGLIIYSIANLFVSDEGINDGNILFDYGNGEINLNGDEYDSSYIDRYANAYKREGIIFVSKEIYLDNETIIYFSDKSSMILYNNGVIVRVSALKDGSYGVLEDGTVISSSKRKVITVINELKVNDNMSITYYSDGSAIILKDGKKILARNSDWIKLNNDNSDLYDVGPSGTSYPLVDSESIFDYTLYYYSDGTIRVVKGNDSFVVRNKEDIVIDRNSGMISYPNYNEASVIYVNKLKDGTIVTYYSDGSALIDTFYGTSIMVRKSRDIVLDGNDSFYEILKSTDMAFSSYDRECPNGDVVTYYNDGSGVIRYKDGTSVYVSENSNIKFDINGNIKNISEIVSKEVKVSVFPDGTIVTEFDNGRSRIENSNGNDYITSSDSIVYDKGGNVIPDQYEINKFNPRDGIDDDNDDIIDEEDGTVDGSISEIYDNLFVFSISNKSSKKIDYKLVLEESSNYEKYNYSKLDYNYVYYDLMFEDVNYNRFKFDTPITLNEKNNYVLYEGSLDRNSSIDDVLLYVYFDYADLGNEEQDKWFMGTVKLYVVNE